MSYNNEEFPRYIRTAGKVTVVTAIAGICVFLLALFLDVGTQEFNRVLAQNPVSTTTLTVLNTPPQFDWNAYEATVSATTTPTNSGDVMVWEAIGSDSNSAPYFLLVCSTNASPTAQAASGPGNLGSAPPLCGGGITWGVSASTTSGELATVSTTTSETGQFGEIQEWFAWVCDDDPTNPRCNNIPVQGATSTPTAASSSPFHMNYRPQYSGFYNDGPVDPGSNINFQSTSTDPDTVGGEDDLYIVVCSSNANYSSSTNTCTDFIASSTISGVLQHASVTHNINNPTRDQQYAAYGYIYDEHGHTATGSPIYVPFTVNNVAPIVTSGNILLSGSTTNDGVDLTLSEPATETPSSSLRFTITDANSCQNASAGPEITNFEVSVFRSGVGTSSCAVAGDYDPNSCYTSTIGTTTTWKLDCTASSTCAGPSQDYMTYNCTFPLWFVADPTDAQPGNPYSAQNWSAGVAGIDDNYATGTMSTTSNPKQLISYSAIDILAADIVYGSLEPGNDTVTLPATSTILNVGNTGLDEELTGESMCDTFSVSSLCPGSATSTIDADQQRFGLASTTAFLAGTQLSSTSQTALDLNVATTTATSSPTEGTTYWGIAVPGTITYAGSYTGLNTFIAVTSDDNW